MAETYGFRFKENVTSIGVEENTVRRLFLGVYEDYIKINATKEEEFTSEIWKMKITDQFRVEIYSL